MHERKGLSVNLPIDLHTKFTAEREKQNYANNSDYLEEVLKEYYEILEKGGLTMAKEPVKTLAIHISPELMDRVKVHLKKTGVSQKAFIVSLIEKALEDAENTETPTTESE